MVFLYYFYFQVEKNIVKCEITKPSSNQETRKENVVIFRNHEHVERREAG